MDIPITLVRPGMARQKPADESQLGFGTYFSNHMFILDYEINKGWHTPRIVPYAPFILEPAAMVLHYGQEVFEGHKAYRHPDNRIALFRAGDNLKRMHKSCDQLCIPDFPTELVYEGMKKLIQIDKDWIPSAPGTSLYVRPAIIANEAFLGVRPAHEYIFFIITGPVGAYYPEGFNPVKIFVTDKYVRAVPGGVGHVKTAGNYAASIMAAVEAQQKGYTQVQLAEKLGGGSSSFEPHRLAEKRLDRWLIEYFFDPKESSWSKVFQDWQERMWSFIVDRLGIHEGNIRWRRHNDSERSHYSKDTYDLDYCFPFGWKELWGIAYRTDYDLIHSTDNLKLYRHQASQPNSAE